MNFTKACKKLFEVENKKLNFKDALEFIKEHPNKLLDFWKHEGIPILLLQELISIYEVINTDKLEREDVEYLSIIMEIAQTLANNKEIRAEMVKTNLPFYFYPYMNLSQNSELYEELRIYALKYINVFMIYEDKSAVNFFRKSELVPLSLRCLDIGCHFSKLLASNIFLFVLKDKEGLMYAVQTLERFITIGVVLNVVVGQCINAPDTKLIKNILECYVILVTEENVRLSFGNTLPKNLLDEKILRRIESDEECKKLFQNFYGCIKNGEVFDFSKIQN